MVWSYLTTKGGSITDSTYESRFDLFNEIFRSAVLPTRRGGRLRDWAIKMALFPRSRMPGLIRLPGSSAG
jgi:hypothetical protein